MQFLSIQFHFTTEARTRACFVYSINDCFSAVFRRQQTFPHDVYSWETQQFSQQEDFRAADLATTGCYVWSAGSCKFPRTHCQVHDLDLVLGFRVGKFGKLSRAA